MSQKPTPDELAYASYQRMCEQLRIKVSEPQVYEKTAKSVSELRVIDQVFDTYWHR
jgi:hypothetical protein